MILLATATPTLPEVGDLHWVSSDIRSTLDEKLRPCVVVRVPLSINHRITIVTRTTDPKLVWRGRPSAPMPQFGLKDPGTWSHRETVEARLWKPPEVGLKLGRIDVVEVSDILWSLRIVWGDL